MRRTIGKSAEAYSDVYRYISKALKQGENVTIEITNINS